MQPLGTKKIKQPLGTKKIMQPLRTKKNHATSWIRKIMQPLGTKKIMQVGAETTYRAAATSRDKERRFFLNTSEFQKNLHNVWSSEEHLSVSQNRLLQV